MIDAAEGTGRRVVLGPDCLLRGLLHETEAGLLEAWGAGKLAPVVTPPLLRVYLRLLAAAGLPEGQLRHWALWCTAPGRSVFADEEDGESEWERSAAECCAEAALRGGAACVVSGLPRPTGCGVSWLGAEDFLADFAG